MTNHDMEARDHEQSPAEELWRVAHEAVHEHNRVVSEAYVKRQEILSALSDDEITALVAELGRHERPSGGAGAVTFDLIIDKPRLAMVIAERHFDDCTSYYDKAVVIINDYLHGLWKGEYVPSDANMELTLKTATYHRESYERSRSRGVTSNGWYDNCC